MSCAKVLIALAMLGTACGGGKPGASGADASGRVTVELKEFTLTPASSSAPAGEITFVARNVGTIDHQLVVLKTDLDPSAVPVRNFKADEMAPGVKKAGEIKEFKPGSAATATFDLDPGRYVLICNVPTHYNGGMRAAFAVR
jgi:uncharacterized cupredoxin-like copper-binding protein